ncbi:MDR family MFS transporter [Austwickia chelonae]|uniref:MDR family MFS transporter n=1 Tax=Austwickia chelonae TaxID=100225 RepID=UPI00068C2456
MGIDEHPATPGAPVSPASTGSDTGATAFVLGRDERKIFAGLMIAMFVASISQTIVGPAMPRIVAELGGMEHYSWIATAAMLVSAISVPIVGKLSDLHGRRTFCLGGIVVFMLGSVVAGSALNFWMLVAARALQGLGMGTLMTLSQTIVGDMIPPRQRGKYQGIMGSVFGLTSVAGPLAGGFVTDHWGWRWLFFAALPFGVVAFVVLAASLHLPHERRDARLDWPGILTLSPALVLLLTATTLGGTAYPWSSPRIVGMYVVGAVLLLVFVVLERRSDEPILPLHLFGNSSFALSVLASFVLSMIMFGAVIYIPVYAQGVLGASATNSGMILMPLMVALVLVGIVGGMFITRTGRYKELCVLGVLVVALGYLLLVRLDRTSTEFELTVAMAVLGVGLGACNPVYTLVVQNSVMRSDLGVATAGVQFFRNVGSTVGVAVFGTVMTTRLPGAIAAHLPGSTAPAHGVAGVNAGSVLDPATLRQLPPVVAEAVRWGLADSLHTVFLVGIPLAGLTLLLTLGITPTPLRDTVHTDEGQARELLDTMGRSAAGDLLAVPLGHGSAASRTKERLLGLQLALLAEQAGRGGHPYLLRAVEDLGDGDLGRGISLLDRTSLMLTTEDHEIAARSEKYAAEVAAAGERPGGVLSPDLQRTLAAAAAELDDEHVLSTVEPLVTERHAAVDLDSLSAVNSALTAALLVDLIRRPGQRTVGSGGTTSEDHT